MSLRDVLQRLNPLTAADRVVAVKERGRNHYLLESGGFDRFGFDRFDCDLETGTITPWALRPAFIGRLPLDLPPVHSLYEAIVLLEEVLGEAKQSLKGITVLDSGYLAGAELKLLRLADGRELAYHQPTESELDVSHVFVGAVGREGVAYSIKERHELIRLYELTEDQRGLTAAAVAKRIEDGEVALSLETRDQHPYQAYTRYRAGERHVAERHVAEAGPSRPLLSPMAAAADAPRPEHEGNTLEI